MDLGVQIIEKQEYSKWGTGFINQLSKDLKNEFPDISGFSKRNLELIRQWVQFYNPLHFLNAKQVVSQTEDSNFPIEKQLVSQLEISDNDLLV